MLDLKGNGGLDIPSERGSNPKVGTHEISPCVNFPSGTMGFPSSSKHFEMSNVARVRAIVKNKSRRAKCLPGQILKRSRVTSEEGCRRI